MRDNWGYCPLCLDIVFIAFCTNCWREENGVPRRVKRVDAPGRGLIGYQPQTKFAETFARAWRVFCAQGSKRLHAGVGADFPHRREVRDDIWALLDAPSLPQEILDSPGFRGLNTQHNWLREQHGLISDIAQGEEKCARCGHFRIWHEAGEPDDGRKRYYSGQGPERDVTTGPCIVAFNVLPFLDMPERLPCGCPFFGRVLEERWCACPGFVEPGST